MLQDKSFPRIAKAAENDDQSWPTDLQVQTEGSDETKPFKATTAACKFDREAGILYYEGRIWVPMYEPLTIAIIKNIYDAPVSGHLGRDTTLAQVARK